MSQYQSNVYGNKIKSTLGEGNAASLGCMVEVIFSIVVPRVEFNTFNKGTVCTVE